MLYNLNLHYTFLPMLGKNWKSILYKYLQSKHEMEDFNLVGFQCYDQAFLWMIFFRFKLVRGFFL